MKFILQFAVGISALLLGTVFYVGLQNTNWVVKKNTADIENVNQFVTMLSGRIDDLQTTTQKLGSFTTLNSTDRLTDFPTTYNANIGKTVEIGTTSIASITTLSNLVSVGTLTTGVWNATPITVLYGGTGSTTLSSNNILYGNGTGIIKNCDGYGTSGQFLTSGGNGACPSWTTAAIDLTGNYSWTGNNNFAGAITNVKNLNASSTVVINQISYTFPATGGSQANQVLQNDGSNNLSWGLPLAYDGIVDPSTGTTTFIIPFGAFSTNGGFTAASNLAFSPPSTTTAPMVTINTINAVEILMNTSDANLSNFTNSHDFIGSFKTMAKFTATSSLNWFVGAGDIQDFQNIHAKGYGIVLQQDGIFRCYADSGAASSTVNFSTSLPFNALKWNTFEIVKNSASSVSCLVNGQTMATISTNVPTGAYTANSGFTIDTIGRATRSVYMMPGIIMKINASGY